MVQIAHDLIACWLDLHTIPCMLCWTSSREAVILTF